MRSKLSVALALAGTLVLIAVAVGTVVSVAAGLNPKALFNQNIQQQRGAAAQAVPGRQKSDKHLPAPTSEKGTRLAGIEDIQQGPVPSSEFLVNNQWHGPKSGDTWWGVYAGAKGQGEGNPTVPAVYVETSTPTPDGYSMQTTFVGTFAAANADSSLKITAVNGSVVDLQTQSGRVYHFNLTTHEYQQ